MNLQFNIYYHIYNHSNENDNIFREPENYRYFLQQYKKYIYPVASTLAYCLMPNHFHLLVKIRSEEEIRRNKYSSSNLPGFQNLEGLKDLKEEELSNKISRQYSNLFNSYSKAFNKRYNRRGSLFLKNFKRKAITKDNYLLAVVSYIHLNPVHHGFVNQTADWQWSSYNSILENNSDLIEVSEVLIYSKTWMNLFLFIKEKAQTFLRQTFQVSKTWKV